MSVFKNYRAKGTTVRAKVVDEPTEVRTREGNSVTVLPGDVIIETSHPDLFDVLPADAWKSTGYATTSAPAVKPVVTDSKES